MSTFGPTRGATTATYYRPAGYVAAQLPPRPTITDDYERTLNQYIFQMLG